MVLCVSAAAQQAFDQNTALRPENNRLPPGGLNSKDPTHQLWNIDSNAINQDEPYLHDRIPPRPNHLLETKRPDEKPDRTHEPTIVIPSNINNQRSTSISTKKTQEGLSLVKRIYRCRDGKVMVFVDEDARKRFTQCTLFAEENIPVYREEDLHQKASQQDINSCPGTLIYKGNTYVLPENLPCPIPEVVFQNIRPVQANPSYYMQK